MKAAVDVGTLVGSLDPGHAVGHGFGPERGLASAPVAALTWEALFAKHAGLRGPLASVGALFLDIEAGPPNQPTPHHSTIICSQPPHFHARVRSMASASHL